MYKNLNDYGTAADAVINSRTSAYLLVIRRLLSNRHGNRTPLRPAARRKILRKLCFSLLGNNRLRLASGERTSLRAGVEPLKFSAFHGALLRQPELARPVTPPYTGDGYDVTR